MAEHKCSSRLTVVDPRVGKGCANQVPNSKYMINAHNCTLTSDTSIGIMIAVVDTNFRTCAV